MSKTIEERLEKMYMDMDNSGLWDACDEAAIIADWNAAVEAMRQTVDGLSWMIANCDGIGSFDLDGHCELWHSWDDIIQDETLGLEALQAALAKMEETDGEDD